MADVQVEAAHYGSGYHYSSERYYCYIEQITLIQSRKPQSVVEIGVGSRFVARELRALGLRLLTVDIDAALEPDCVGSVEALPLGDGSCDLLSCCEVLEHLPFERFGACLREIARVTHRSAIVSLPNVAPILQLEFRRGWSKPRHIRYQCNRSLLRAPQPHVFDGQHYWEIGKRGYPVERIVRTMQQAGFTVQRSYRFHLNPYHHFFLLEKSAG